MARNHDNHYLRFGIVQSLLHAGQLRGIALPQAVLGSFEALAERSLPDQKRIEAADKLDFETYRPKYPPHDTLIIGETRFRAAR
jgi:hypothetical protein